MKTALICLLMAVVLATGFARFGEALPHDVQSIGPETDFIVVDDPGEPPAPPTPSGDNETTMMTGF